MDVVAYDFDGSIALQQPRLEAQGIALRIKSMRQFERSARLWASASVFNALCAEVLEEDQPCFSLIGSGDYHHVTLALLKKHTAPLTLVLFDNHPDWMRPPHQYHCGSWVYSAARLAHVQRIIIIGLESGDISASHFKKGDIESYTSGKTVLLPYQPVTVDNRVQLHSLLAKDLEQGVAEILEAIPTQAVYLSIDKDCLSVLDVKTNWEQGSLRLSTVVEVMRRIATVKNVIGADSVGDFSLPQFNSPLKWLASLLDRRENPMVTLEEASRLNAMANVAMIQALETI